MSELFFVAMLYNLGLDSSSLGEGRLFVKWHVPGGSRKVVGDEFRTRSSNKPSCLDPAELAPQEDPNYEG